MGSCSSGGELMDVLILRFEAPLMSFGGVTVDASGVTRRFPAASMICGLLGNALGWHHRDWEQLQDLQDHLSLASRIDVAGTHLTDYQTVDLGQDFLLDDRAWTTRGVVEKRAGASSKQTHILHREYWADAVVSSAISVATGAGVDVEILHDALKQPSRPLFIGRKNCLPASPIVQGCIQAASLQDALLATPLHPRASRDPETGAGRAGTQLPATSQDPTATPINDQRDWANQIHAGQRWVREVELEYGVSQ